jgi:xanthine dehydrogenase accessory factor
MKDATLQQVLADQAAKRTVVLATDLTNGDERLIYPHEPGNDPLMSAAQDAARLDKSGVVESGGPKVFLNVYNPPLRLIIVGAVHIAQPLARMAAMTGYDVTVVDPRAAFASAERFPDVTVMTEWPDDAMATLAPNARTAIVTLTHDPKIDDPALEVALRAPVFYIGALGSKKTHSARLQRLGEAGFSDVELARICGPIGLAIGAKSPAEIAVAVLAQITEQLRQPPA